MSTYTADDRESGEFPTDTNAEYPTDPQGRFDAIRGGNLSGAALRTLWAERDVIYSRRPKYLTDDEIIAIRSFRDREAAVSDDATLSKEVAAWYPPEHGQ